MARRQSLTPPSPSTNPPSCNRQRVRCRAGLLVSGSSRVLAPRGIGVGRLDRPRGEWRVRCWSSRWGAGRTCRDRKPRRGCEETVPQRKRATSAPVLRHRRGEEKGGNSLPQDKTNKTKNTCRRPPPRAAPPPTETKTP